MFTEGRLSIHFRTLHATIQHPVNKQLVSTTEKLWTREHSTTSDFIYALVTDDWQVTTNLLHIRNHFTS